MMNSIDKRPDRLHHRTGTAATEAAPESLARSQAKARAYHRQEITTYWYIAGMLAISLFGALWVVLAQTFAP